MRCSRTGRLERRPARHGAQAALRAVRDRAAHGRAGLGLHGLDRRRFFRAARHAAFDLLGAGGDACRRSAPRPWRSAGSGCPAACSTELPSGDSTRAAALATDSMPLVVLAAMRSITATTRPVSMSRRLARKPLTFSCAPIRRALSVSFTSGSWRCAEEFAVARSGAVQQAMGAGAVGADQGLAGIVVLADDVEGGGGEGLRGHDDFLEVDGTMTPGTDPAITRVMVPTRWLIFFAKP